MCAMAQRVKLTIVRYRQRGGKARIGCRCRWQRDKTADVPLLPDGIQRHPAWISSITV